MGLPHVTFIILPHGDMEGAVTLEADTPAEIDIPAIRAINPSTGHTLWLHYNFACCSTRVALSMHCGYGYRAQQARGERSSRCFRLLTHCASLIVTSLVRRTSCPSGITNTSSSSASRPFLPQHPPTPIGQTALGGPLRLLIYLREAFPTSGSKTLSTPRARRR